MRPYAFPRRPMSAQNENEESTPVNWRRGMLRVWVLTSVAWIMAWAIYLMIEGLKGGLQATGELLVIPVVLFGPPVALLLFGIATGWAFRGFKVDDKPPAK
jgi:hypothetical protein